VGSISGPNVYAIPDVGMAKCLISEPSSNGSNISVTAVAIDHIRHRLIVAFSNHSSTVAAYDMKSYRTIFTVPLPEMNGAPSGVAVDLKSGDVFVSSSKRGVVLKVGSEGERRKVISKFKVSDDGGLGGLVHTSHGYIITVQVRYRKNNLVYIYIDYIFSVTSNNTHEFIILIIFSNKLLVYNIYI
jgi:hypothetical protein